MIKLPFNYKPLWKTLIDKNMTKTKLAEKIKINHNTLAKMSKNEYVSMETLDKICNELNCKIEDIIEHEN